MLKKPTSMKNRKNSRSLLEKFAPVSILGVSTGQCQRALVDETGIVIRTEKGTHNGSEMVALMGRLV
jgi:hypothetical protein